MMIYLLIFHRLICRLPYLQKSALFSKQKVDVYPWCCKGFTSTFLVLKNHVSVMTWVYIRFWSSFFLNFPQESQWIFRTFYILLTLYRVWHRNSLHLKQNVVVTTFYNSYYFSQDWFFWPCSYYVHFFSVAAVEVALEIM